MVEITTKTKVTCILLMLADTFIGKPYTDYDTAQSANLKDVIFFVDFDVFRVVSYLTIDQLTKYNVEDCVRILYHEISKEITNHFTK